MRREQKSRLSLASTNFAYCMSTIGKKIHHDDYGFSVYKGEIREYKDDFFLNMVKDDLAGYDSFNLVQIKKYNRKYGANAHAEHVNYLRQQLVIKELMR